MTATPLLLETSMMEVILIEYDIRLEQQSARPLAVVRRRDRQADLPRVVPDACGFVWNVLRAQQVRGAGRHVAVYLDDAINLEVGVELTAPLPVSGEAQGEGKTTGYGEVVSSTTRSGTVATTTHYGPYAQLKQTHDAIRHWCASHGHTLAGPSWEIYGHWQDEWNRDPSKITTEVFYLLV